MTAPTVSVVMGAYGKRSLSESCLASVLEHAGSELARDWELVLVDNGSPDDTRELFREWEARVGARVVVLDQNRDFAGGFNAGAEAARGRVLLLLSNDIVVTPGALQTLAATAAEPDVGLAAARLVFPHGTLQHAGFGYRRTATGGLQNMHYFYGEPGNLPAARVVLDVDALNGACFAIRSELFAELGGFDHQFRNGAEDIDLCNRVRMRGLRAVYRGDVCMVHREGATVGASPHALENDRRYRARWDRFVDADDEFVARTFGARMNPLADAELWPPVAAEGAAISLEGHLVTLSPQAAELRGLLAA